MNYCCGFNPGISNAIMGIQIATAGINGISNGIRARNNGATPEQAAFCGLTTATVGTSNALIGNAINHGTHSYFGTLYSSFSPGVNLYAPTWDFGFGSGLGYNPVASALAFSTLTNPFMYGVYSPLNFGGYHHNHYHHHHHHHNPFSHHCGGWCC